MLTMKYVTDGGEVVQMGNGPCPLDTIAGPPCFWPSARRMAQWGRRRAARLGRRRGG